jgi:hypothetical protein
MNDLIGIAALMLIPAYLLLRVIIVNEIYSQAAKRIRKSHRDSWARGIFDAHRENADWELVNGRYLNHVLDPRFWTFKQFYPELA